MVATKSGQRRLWHSRAELTRAKRVVNAALVASGLKPIPMEFGAKEFSTWLQVRTLARHAWFSPRTEAEASAHIVAVAGTVESTGRLDVINSDAKDCV